MLCYQCEQAAHGEGCTKVGVCGKGYDTAELHDLLIYTVKGLAQVAVEGRKVGVKDPETDRFVVESLFSTLTNTDYDNERFAGFIKQAVAHREDLKKKVGSAGGWSDFTSGAAAYMPPDTIEAMVKE